MSYSVQADLMRVQLADAMHAAQDLPWLELLVAVRTETESLSKVVREREEAFDEIDRLRSITEDLVTEIPLRRLVWKVIQPTESFTVADVTSRLAAIGAVWPSHKVSNALGYWVNRDRLERLSKGLYRWQPAVLGGVEPLDFSEEAS